MRVEDKRDRPAKIDVSLTLKITKFAESFESCQLFLIEQAQVVKVIILASLMDDTTCME